MTLEEVIIKMRDNVSRTHSNSEYTALSSFDKLVDQLHLFATQINEKNLEINRLQKMCEKNKIDYAIPPKTIPSNKIAPPEIQIPKKNK